MKKSMTGSILLVASLTCSAQTPSEEDNIRSLRSISNLALIARDIASFAASLSDDFVVVVGNGSFLSRDAYIAVFAKDFEYPHSVRFERIVDSIEISSAAGSNELRGKCARVSPSKRLFSPPPGDFA